MMFLRIMKSYEFLPKHLLFFYILVFLLSVPTWASRDTLYIKQSIKDGETLVSARELFELGFFSPNNISPPKRYLGIWYHNLSPQTIVWAANKDQPLLDSSGVFSLEDDATLRVGDGKEKTCWSTPSSSTTERGNISVVLQDNGNLILQGNERIWDRFNDDYSNTLLPEMKLDNSHVLTSWKNDDNPSTGDFTFDAYQQGMNQFVIKNQSEIYWLSGWSQGSVSFNDMPVTLSDMLNQSTTRTSTTATSQELTSTIDFSRIYNRTTYDVYNRLVMNSSGEINYLKWNKKSESWELIWKHPDQGNPCSLFNVCGEFSMCNASETPICTCLPGFIPNSADAWASDDYSGGCARKEIGCEKNDTFVTIRSIANVGYADTTMPVKNETYCKNECLSKCCNAYLFKGQIRKDSSTCWLWSSLMDLKVDSAGRYNVSIRLSAAASVPLQGSGSDNIQKKDPEQLLKPEIMILIIVASTVLLIVAVCFMRRRIALGKAGKEEIQETAMSEIGSETSEKALLSSVGLSDEKLGIDVPYYNYRTLLVATDNFSTRNKLGQGGFGPVYKVHSSSYVLMPPFLTTMVLTHFEKCPQGKLPEGQYIAVKRLSRSSVQGLEEFKNEVLLIAKLQHRNLVRLLGYCLRGEEKVLVYEYMPNKSLDSFIFDSRKCSLLNWERRYDIIMGIARGLVYLHQDSRLRIIHRDLKTSNILLDEDMNPKISDFGLARIFGGNQIQASTDRVIGTFGYMSPEYAIDGLFSIKSDVYSFGVVILEVISGKRNTGSHQSKEALSLLGYAWKLWSESKGLELMDESLREAYDESEVLKCFQVGLLCVQDDEYDRPTMSRALFMLASENPSLPTPKQPLFALKGRRAASASSAQSNTASEIELTVTVEGR
ncbi:PAN/Apple domain [Dillenia turbinata]|uniref:Receptor-like serine/threonine-protein kinase n=1 Tax=Dillenia turbinata TaxID=194707 RepID=A0AAN8UIG9_9MAGN